MGFTVAGADMVAAQPRKALRIFSRQNRQCGLLSYDWLPGDSALQTVLGMSGEALVFCIVVFDNRLIVVTA